MPTSGRCATPTGADAVAALVLVDTSAAVAMLVSDHEDHAGTFTALAGRRLGLCGHAAFESFSVLTRLPGPQRLSPLVARRLLETNFPETRQLSAAAATRLLASLAEQDIAGGAVYDGLVAATAVEHGLPLVSRDRRAAETYQRLGVQLELLG